MAERFLAELKADPGWRAGNVLDLRPEREYLRGHLAGSGHLDPGDGEPPSIFLPPRHEPLLLIVADQDQGERLAAELRSRGRTEVSYLAAGPAQIAELPPDMLATGPATDHLWSPPPWLSEHADLLPPPALGPVLDLACGSGRACAWMAARGYRVTGLDWQPEALQLGARLAASRDVACRFLEADLRDPANLPGPGWAVVLNFRFLQREILAVLGELLVPGGVAFVRTFRDVPGYRGHPHPRHRLQPGELLQAFPLGRFEILAHEESHDPDGRPAAGIVARRKA